SHANLDDAERFQRAQRIARHDTARAKTRGKVFFRTEEITGFELFREERVADPGHDLRGQRRRATSEHDTRGEITAHSDRLSYRRPRHVPVLRWETASMGFPLKIVKILSYTVRSVKRHSGSRSCMVPTSWGSARWMQRHRLIGVVLGATLFVL